MLNGITHDHAYLSGKMAALVEQSIYRNNPATAKRFSKKTSFFFLVSLAAYSLFQKKKTPHNHHLLYITSDYNQVKQYYYALPES